MTTETDIPKGYYRAPNGDLKLLSKVKDIDKDRTIVVQTLCEAAKIHSANMAEFKAGAMQSVADFVARSLEEYGVKRNTGKGKGNITLVTLDGRYKVIRQTQESIVFDERLQAAKARIDECILAWSKGSNGNIKMLVNDAFQVDSAGKINIGRVLGLLRLKIVDDGWQLAMKAITDSMQVASSKRHIRFYELNDATGDYLPITLDLAAV